MHRTVGSKEFPNCLILDTSNVASRIGFKKNNYPANKQVIINRIPLHTLVFITKGRLNVYLQDNSKFEVSSNQMFFISQGSSVVVDVLEDLNLFMLGFEQYQPICYQDSQLDYTDYISDDRLLISTLPLKKSLIHFLESIDDVLTLGIKCSAYHELKMKELFFLLKSYYTPLEISNFMQAIFDKQSKFKDFIHNNYAKVKNVNELIDLSELGRTQFFEQFKKVFGISVKQWLIQKKAEEIQKRLQEPNASIKEVMLDFDFSSASQFNRFCRYYLGNSPSKLVSNSND